MGLRYEKSYRDFSKEIQKELLVKELYRVTLLE